MPLFFARFIEQPAQSTMGRGWVNGLPALEGIFMSSRGVLVSPAREDDDKAEDVSPGGTPASSAGSGALMPRFSPVSDPFVKKPLW